MKILPVFLLLAFLSICSIAQSEPVDDSFEAEADYNAFEAEADYNAFEAEADYNAFEAEAGYNAFEAEADYNAFGNEADVEESGLRDEEQRLPTLDFHKLFCSDCRHLPRSQQIRCRKECGSKSNFNRVCCFHCPSYLAGPERTKCQRLCLRTCPKKTPCCRDCEKYLGYSYAICKFKCKNC